MRITDKTTRRKTKAIRAQSLRLVEKNLAKEALVIGDGVAEIERRLQQYEQQYSMYIEDSQVSQINKNAGEKYTAVSAECLELLERSILVSQEFDGLFDITIAPLTQLWGISSEEGAILNALTSIPQLLLATTMPFFMSALGIRIFLLPLSAGFIVITFFIPFIHGFTNLIIAHFISGLILGCFVTSTIQIMMKYMGYSAV